MTVLRLLERHYVSVMIFLYFVIIASLFFTRPTVAEQYIWLLLGVFHCLIHSFKDKTIRDKNELIDDLQGTGNYSDR